MTNKPTPVEGLPSAETVLVKCGVFAGVTGLRDFLECQSFWDKQPYGTRFYFDGGKYLHRDVLGAAIKALDEAALSAGEKAEAGGGEAVAFYCEHKHRCKWMASSGYPAWGTPERHLEAWQEKHREYCGGEFHLLYTAQPESGAVPDDSPAATETRLLAFVARIMRDHRAQLPSETRDLYGGGCGCPQCDEARQLLAAATAEGDQE